MSNRDLSTFLYDLIKGLSKAEKKHFHIYAKRNSKDREFKFTHLFDFIDKSVDPDEKSIRKKFPTLNSTQISDLKSHLYEQILVSLKLLKRKDPELKIREQLDWAYILYTKGLYSQSLFILSKAKDLARLWHRDTLAFEIIEFEKIIESRHITGGTKERALELTNEAFNLRKSLMAEGNWSDLALKMYDKYLKIGHVKNLDEFNSVKEFFDAEKLLLEEQHLSFYGKIFKFQAYVWYNYICQDFKQCYVYAYKWIELFNNNPLFKKLDGELYIKGLHNLLASLYYCGSRDRYLNYYKVLSEYVEKNVDSFEENLKLKAFHYIETAKLNLFYSEGRFDEGILYLEEFKSKLFLHQNFIDKHRIMLFNYKMACMYFGAGDYKSSIQYLNEIVNLSNNSLREDVQSFSRILLLISHFELGNITLIEYQLQSVSRFLKSLKENQTVQVLLLKFLKRNLYANTPELKIEFNLLLIQIQEATKNPFEKRALLYLDIVSWIESKIENIPVKDVIRNKFLINRIKENK